MQIDLLKELNQKVQTTQKNGANMIEQTLIQKFVMQKNILKELKKKLN